MTTAEIEEEIGRKLRELSDHLRGEASFHRSEAAEYDAHANSLHEAWTQWDVQTLTKFDALTDEELEFLRSKKGG